MPYWRKRCGDRKIDQEGRAVPKRAARRQLNGKCQGRIFEKLCRMRRNRCLS